MPTQQKFTAEQMVAALTETRGMVYHAANRLGCSAQTVYNYVKRYATVRQAKEQAEGMMLDNAELALNSAILGGQPWAVMFVLKTKGKQRGYVERQEITGANAGPVVFRVVYDEPETNGAGAGVSSPPAPPTPETS